MTTSLLKLYTQLLHVSANHVAILRLAKLKGWIHKGKITEVPKQSTHTNWWPKHVAGHSVIHTK